MDDATPRAVTSDDALRTPPVGTPVRSRHRLALKAAAGRLLRAVWVQSVVMLVLTLLLAPAVAFCAAGIWATVTYVTTVRALVALVQRFDLSPAFARLDTLDAALRVGLTSAAYFAVVSSSMVLAAGVLGRRRRPTLLLVGLLLLIPSALIFTLSARLTADIVGSRLGLAAPALSALFLYALLDALLVGALLVDTRPRRGRARRRRLGRSRGAQASAAPASAMQRTPATPMVRFGPTPTQPLDAPHPLDGPAEPMPASPGLSLEPRPSILTRAVDEPAKSAGGAKDAEAQPLAGVAAPVPPGP